MENAKIERDGRGENEEDDQKMEEFFALIRSFREARNRRKEELREIEEMKEKKKKKMRRPGGEEQSSWIPTFRWDDFTQEIEFGRPPMIFASPCNKNKQPEDNNLDLNLRL